MLWLFLSMVWHQVAIKRLLGNWFRDVGMVARFREEISLMSQLDHPNGSWPRHCLVYMMLCVCVGLHARLLGTVHSCVLLHLGVVSSAAICWSCA